MSAKLNKVAMVVAAMTMATGAWAETTTGHASASVLNPISVAEGSQKLNFGAVYGNAAGGTVILTAEETTQRSGTASIRAQSTATSGVFTVTGEAGLTYTFAVDASASLAGPTNSTPMGVTLTKSAGTGTLSGTTLYSTGTEVQYVGGTLTVGTNQMPGAYAGTFTVTVAYN